MSDEAYTLQEEAARRFRDTHPEEAQKIEAELLNIFQQYRNSDEMWGSDAVKRYPVLKDFESNPDRAAFIREVFKRNGVKAWYSEGGYSGWLIGQPIPTPRTVSRSTLLMDRPTSFDGEFDVLDGLRTMSQGEMKQYIGSGTVTHDFEMRVVHRAAGRSSGVGSPIF